MPENDKTNECRSRRLAVLVESQMSPYEPTDRDKLWVQLVIDTLGEGGIVAFPTTRLIYKVSHKNKTWTLINPGILESLAARKTHQMTVDVLAAVGWSVVVRDI